MSLPQEIQEALDTYDNNKGFWRRLFRRDQAAIRALRSLSVNDQTNPFKIYQCFIENLPKPTQASYQVYQALLTYLNNVYFCDVPEIIDQLHFAKLIKHINLDVLNKLNARQFKSLASILKKLKLAKLCTLQNLANIIPYFAAPEMLSIIEAMLNANAYERLNQEKLIHLFKLLEELYPEISLNHVNADQSAVQIASALILLDQTELLTCDNRSKLWAKENQFLLRNEAYLLVWRPLETYLPQLENIDERQSAFDRLINLSQQENPEEKIESLIQELNQKPSSSNHAYRPRANTMENKYNTAPPASRHNNRNSLTLEASHLVRQPTI
ncbi:MAG: hypothetical protein WA659_00870 [Candidatus Aquirickettsiella sp.]